MTENIVPAIRHATNTDATLLAELGPRTFYDTFAADNKPEDIAAYLAEAFTTEQLATELADPRRSFLIAEIDGRAAGYAQLRAGHVPECVSGARPVELARLYATREWLGGGGGGGVVARGVGGGRG